MNRLPAFTILELTAAMFLSGLVIGMAYFAEGIITNRFVEYRDASEQLNELEQLDMIVRYDIERSPTVQFAGNAFELNGQALGAVTYELTDAYVVRKDAHATDTFRLAVEALQQNFRNLEQQTPGGLVDEVYFEGRVGALLVPFHFTKQYSATVLMQQAEKTE